MDKYKAGYLKLLAEKFPNLQAVASEIINLRAILNLPKGTEHFISDIHGEHLMFDHLLRTASGVIKSKIDELFKDRLDAKEKRCLASLIYYPEQKLKKMRQSNAIDKEWYKSYLYYMVEVCRVLSTKYTRSKVRKALPKDFAYIIEELLHVDEHSINKEKYFNEIINSIIELDRADSFIIELSKLMHRLAIDYLHIVGDIFDRGKRADLVMDKIINYHSVDIQWGNHDIVWMGAALGSEVCIMVVLSDCLKYGNTEMLEDGYGINLRALEAFSSKIYADDECKPFKTSYNTDSCAKMHKAVSVIRFKLEDKIRIDNPEFDMQSQIKLKDLDIDKGLWRGYPLKDKNFPTIKPSNPIELTEEEKEVVAALKHSFLNSQKLNTHLRFLLEKGSIYLKYNGNLLFHGCIPLDEKGDFQQIEFEGKTLSGKSFMDYCDNRVRRAAIEKDNKNLDFIWYLWCGKNSPLFGKDKMATFERLLVDAPETHVEKKQSYFDYQEQEQTCIKILREFGLDENTGHIINGHIPVKYKKGESPVKANGKLIVIDGGMSKPYQRETGIAGYTLTFNSYGLAITAHQPFDTVEAVINNDSEILSTKFVVENVQKRLTVGDSDTGKMLKQQIADLQELREAFLSGEISQKASR